MHVAFKFLANRTIHMDAIALAVHSRRIMNQLTVANQTGTGRTGTVSQMPQGRNRLRETAIGPANACAPAARILIFRYVRATIADGGEWSAETVSGGIIDYVSEIGDRDPALK